ncbi:Hypothetical protein MAG6070 [Mycoplasmopsis agalactiae PG2]|uniref:Uncharacterized protein n=1 Tax=Mycoplasmopsis agalactiae (strain NCTC 10123 / CIP 59.7 / PG2) TaxID=347257 RepID=A5IZ48_MYCAP|nr:Hypothetical protein MAG6070 [Mycoplasmopsis agalactiae PG2]
MWLRCFSSHLCKHCFYHISGNWGIFTNLLFKNLSCYKKANKTANYAKEKRYSNNYTNSRACWNHLMKIS